MLTDYERDVYYITLLLVDSKEYRGVDVDILLQDRYYLSIQYYGQHQNSRRPLFQVYPLHYYIQPKWFFYCVNSYEAKCERSRDRILKQAEEKLLSSSCEHKKSQLQFDKIMDVIDKKYHNVIKIDTTSDSVEKYGEGIYQKYIKNEKV